MTIKGLTDRGQMFPKMGDIRKGAKKDPDKNRPGRDLDYFRIDTDEETENKLRLVYGAALQPKKLNFLFPFDEIELVWDAWNEAYVSGQMIARSDGEKMVFWRDHKTGEVKVSGGEPFTPEPANKTVGSYTSKNGRLLPILLKPVGRLTVILPELQRLATFTVHTTSVTDIRNLSAQLESLHKITGGHLSGVPLQLLRKPQMISTPNQDGSRTRREKHMLSIEADPTWVALKIKSMELSARPENSGVLRLSSAVDAVVIDSVMVDERPVEIQDEIVFDEPIDLTVDAMQGLQEPEYADIEEPAQEPVMPPKKMKRPLAADQLRLSILRSSRKYDELSEEDSISLEDLLKGYAADCAIGDLKAETIADAVFAFLTQYSGPSKGSISAAVFHWINPAMNDDLLYIPEEYASVVFKLFPADGNK